MVTQEELSKIPAKPGVYLMKNAEGRIIYVGKAVSLRNRVRQYFQASRNPGKRIESMIAQIESLEYIVTDSEVEALILENNLIKKHRPRYNVRLRDDKQYPFIRISMEEEYPRIMIVRRAKKDGSRYFGPYTDSQAVRDTIALIRRIFPIRNCGREINPGAEERACLNYHINRCLAPCIGAVTKEAYRDMIHQIIMFLEGRQEEVEQKLEKAMNEASEELAFERAAAYRDRLQAVRKVIEKQKIVSTVMEDMDVIASASERTFSIVQVFQIRGGKLIGREHFLMTEGTETTQEELIQAFISQYYSEVALIPKTILTPCHIDGEETVTEWLRTLRKGAVNLSVPQRGEKKELMHLAEENATELLRQARIQREQQEREKGTALSDLQQMLGLGVLPDRIEAYDISNFQGNETVASMVVFEDGIARPDQYRKFRIRTVEGPNDFASMQEVIRRRFKRGLEERNDAVLAREGKFARFPSLVLIDGGVGQLNAAREVMEELGLGHLETIGLAKREEEVFRPGNPTPFILPRDSAALHLLQQVRDEAHRFAITYHRKLRDKRTTQSLLDSVPGIGPTRKKALIKKFGSLRGVRLATIEELQEVPGISRELAEAIKDIVGSM